MTAQQKQQGYVAKGVVAFSNLTECEVYQGQSTGRYTVVITMDDAEASKLSDFGVKLKDYEGKAQRKFASKFPVLVKDLDDNPVRGEIPYGSEVRVLWVPSKEPHPQHGVGTYAEQVRVVTLAETSQVGGVPEDF
jgi:hypothetical protein|tara:strand:- start:210 stop:614 length:405 start_codon:yes stop_codon:yes gene_type:complete